LAALTGKCGKFPQPPEPTDNDAKRQRFGGLAAARTPVFVIGVRGSGLPAGRDGAEWRERAVVADTRGMPVTKITLSTAMRARDVSRPHEGHLAEAAVRENTGRENTGRENTGREDATARQAEVPPPKPTPAPSPAPPPAKPRPAEPPPAPTRRRRRRGR
jgi:hypothetical protein